MADIVVEKNYKANIAQVWQALTDKNQMKEWYIDVKDFKAEVGFVFEFSSGPAEDRIYLHRCEITEVIKEKKLTYSWSYSGYEGKSYVTFELFDEGATTRVKLTHKGIESFPKSNPDFDPNNFNTGWGQIMGTSLKEFLDK